MDPSVPENKHLFDALWQRMLAVGRQGCFIASFEMCKLILSINPHEDPCGVLQCIDYYALRAQEFQGLLQLAGGYESVKSLSLLPNMAYSTALAHFKLGNVHQADRTIQQALALFPCVLAPLINAAGGSASQGGLDWALVLTHPHFTANVPSSSASLRFLVDIFVKRNTLLWKQPDVMAWLHSNSIQLVDLVEQQEDEVLCYLWSVGVEVLDMTTSQCLCAIL